MTFSVWSLVAKKKRCKDGSRIFKGYLPTLNNCALACKGVSRWFVFGAREFNNDNCQGQLCKCYCETGIGETFLGEEKDDLGYNLYTYSKFDDGK